MDSPLPPQAVVLPHESKKAGSLNLQRNTSRLESNCWALSSQAWVLQQLGRKLKTQKNRATVIKPTKIGRRTIVRKSIKKSTLHKTGPGRIRTTGLCRLKQLLYLCDTCARWLTKVDVKIKTMHSEAN